MFVVYGLFSEGEVFYIGKTTDDRLSLRLSEHKSHALKPKPKDVNRKIYNKIRKLIREQKDIVIRPLFVTENEDEQNAKEIELIALYGRDLRNGGKLYNSTDGGDGVTGYVYTPEVRKKMSDLKKGHKYLVGKPRPDMVDRFSKTATAYEVDGSKIKTFSSQRVMAAELNVNFKTLNNATARGSDVYSSVLGRRFQMQLGDDEVVPPVKNPSKTRFIKKIEQYTLTGELVMVYDSAHDAAKAVDSLATSIRAVCSGNTKSLKGYIWKYQE